MLRETHGARCYNDQIVLTKATKTTDELGHTSYGTPVDVITVYAQVTQMSATKAMLTFQQANVVGVDFEFRNPHADFNGLRWNGHDVHFPTPENVDNRGRIVRVSGWYQIDE